MATPILNITELTAGEATPYATVNAMGRAIEAAANDWLEVDFTSGNVALTDAQYQGYVLFRAANNTVARNLTLQEIKRLVVIDNTDGTATLSIILGSTTLTLAPGKKALIYTDGTTNGLVSLFETGGSAITTESGTTYDALNTHSGKYIRLTNAGAKTVTFRPDSTHLMPPNGEWHFRNVGAGNATLTAGAGVTLNAPSGGSLVVAQDMTVTVKWVAADEYDVIGQTV
ncbi:MAG: hypothetical protein EP324_08225 [Gammaproteobacteria bacterium]|nr:MAG: hypothetical protein EP324_08225 [Gammaproteobacteria bacterium]